MKIKRLNMHNWMIDYARYEQDNTLQCVKEGRMRNWKVKAGKQHFPYMNPTYPRIDTVAGIKQDGVYSLTTHSDYIEGHAQLYTVKIFFVFNGVTYDNQDNSDVFSVDLEEELCKSSVTNVRQITLAKDSLNKLGIPLPIELKMQVKGLAYIKAESTQKRSLLKYKKYLHKKFDKPSGDV